MTKQLYAPAMCDLAREIGGLEEAALVAALEAIPSAALVVTAEGHVAYGNALAQQALQSDRDGTTHALRASLQNQRRTTVNVPGRFTLTTLKSSGLPSYFLAVRQRAPDEPATRLPIARRRWGLTPRQTEVLGLLARGLSNRAIAAVLGCAKRTAELHIAALLEKIGAESRSEIVARFWTELA